MTKISIIIPAYNAQTTIQNAVESALNQTLYDIEVLIVDDGSTDKTPQYLQSIAQTDNRVRVITFPENKGLVCARKAACAEANGCYTMFLDSDDLLAENACETAYNAICREQTDILRFGIEICGDASVLEAQKYDIDTMYARMNALHHKVVSNDKAGLMGHPSSKDTIDFWLWNKIYKTSVLKRAVTELPNTYLNIAEDILISFLISFFAKSYACIPDTLYRYHFGIGISTDYVYSEFKMYPKIYYVYTFLQNWVQKQGCEANCKSRLDKMKTQAEDDVVYTFLTIVPKDKQQAYLNQLLRYLSAEDFVCIANRLIGCNLSLAHKAAEICASLDRFQTKNGPIKTVATFYFRIRNGGIERVLSQITDIWINSGYKVVLFTDEPAHQDDYPLNAEVVRVILPPYKDCNPKSFINRTQAFRKALLQYNIDIMVYHAWDYRYLVADLLTVKLLGIPVTMYTHNLFCCSLSVNDIYHTRNCINLHKQYALCDSVLALTECDAVYWKAMGLKCLNVVNPNSLPLETQTAPLNGQNILMVCRFSPEKQIIDALKIMELVHKQVPTATLTLVGKGDAPWYTNEIESYIRSHNMETYVHLAGFQKNVLPFYQSADIKLITSRFEGFCLTLMESKICGLPLVTYDLTNLDSVRSGKGMVVVPQNDIHGAARALVDLLTDDDKKRALGKEARESAEEIYNIDFAAMWNAIFENTLNSKEKEPCNSAETAALKAFTYHIEQNLNLRNTTPVTHTKNTENMDLYMHVRALEATVKEIRCSTSYRLGWLLTTPFRKLKDFVKGQKYTE